MQPTKSQIKEIAQEAYLTAIDEAWKKCGEVYTETMEKIKQKYNIFSVTNVPDFHELSHAEQEKLEKIEEMFWIKVSDEIARAITDSVLNQECWGN